MTSGLHRLPTLLPVGAVRRAALAAAGMAVAIGLALAATSAQAAAPEPLLSVPEDGTPGASAGRLRFPVGIAADPNLPGDVYIADSSNARISEFTPWGQFVKAWGWDVAPDGAPGDTATDELETCTTICQKGKEGAGDGEFKFPEAIAVDGAGQVYVIEASNHRVQKFDPTGGVGEEEAVFVTKFGEAGEGQLTGGSFAYTRKLAACSSTDDIYVAQGGSEAIRRFGSSGTFKEEIKGGDLTGVSLEAVASDSGCNLYAALEKAGKSEVRKLKGSGPSAEFLDPVFAPENPIESAKAVAVDASGNVYVGIRPVGASEPAKVQKYDKDGNCLTCGKEGEGGLPGFDRSPTTQIEDLAATGACKADDAYTIHFKPTQPPKSYFSAFGDPPDGTVCEPPKAPPQIAAQFARSVETSKAELAAQINPRFWNDTTYHLEYGTAPCRSGGCTATTPAVLLTTKTVGHPINSESVFLEGLEEGTTYHYRFVAVSSGGGPVYGTDPDGGEGPEEASFEDGTEASFTTYRKPQVPPCPANPAFRGGASEVLPDCRAYELVSPLDKEGGDIVVLGEQTTGLPAVLSQSAVSGDRMVFGSYRSFAGAAAAPYTTQYIAARQAGVGWATHPISPPRGKRLELITPTFDTEFRAFSPDLCEAWLNSFAEPPLAAGAPPEYQDLYRKTDSECGGPSYEALNTTTPPNLKGGQPKDGSTAFRTELQGRSADGKTAIYLANDRLAEEAQAAPAECVEKGEGCLTQLNGFREGAQRFLCQLPGGGTYADTCTAGGSSGSVIGGRNRSANLAGAISADGNRVFWSATHGGPGPIYLRQNPFAQPSAQLHGSALGSADLIGPVTATGNVVVTQATIKKVHLTKGSFAVGQEITSAGGAIPAGTTITKVQQPEPGVFTLTISAPATASEPETTLTGLASATATNASASSGEFSAGQNLGGEGIARGTTITEVSGATLTLSIPATQTKAGASIEAFSPCTEPGKACTVPISEAAELQAGAQGSQFVAAAKDGSRVLFTTEAAGKDVRLYEARVGEEGSPTLIAHQLATSGAGASGILGVSEDATRVYLASREALTPPSEENPGHQHAEAGQANLYFEAGGTFHFIGALSSVPGGDLAAPSPIAALPFEHNSRVAPDGLSAAFTSAAPMTGYDNTDLASGAADAEVFLYDAAANGGQGKLVCASCNPGGARPRGKVVKEAGVTFNAAAHIPVFENQLYGARVLSDDGDRLFFEAQDALVPRDSNGKEDVYQWEAPGTGGCNESTPTYSPPNGGCIDLVSSGQSSLDSRFLDASPSGDDVFFTTLSSLVSQDYGLQDVYDARVEGGLPGPASPPAACEGEACQGPYVAPTDPTPASSSFQGAGNVDEAAAKPKCPKGKVKKKGKCVKKQPHKKHKRNAHRGRQR